MTLLATLRISARLFSTSRAASTAAPAATSYPFSKTALFVPPSPVPTDGLHKGRGLMQHLQQSLLTPEKRKLMQDLISRRSLNRLQPGSIVTVISDQAPNSFTGVLMGIRRRGPDTSILVRNIVQRTGIEVQFFVNSPTVKEIRLVKKPPKGRARRAKLFYLRDSPEKMSVLASGKR